MKNRAWFLGCLCALWCVPLFAGCPTDNASKFISLSGVDDGDVIDEVKDLKVSIVKHEYDRIEIGVEGDAHPQKFSADTLPDVGGGRREIKVSVGPRYSPSGIVSIAESQRYLSVRSYLHNICKSELAVSLFGGDSRVTAVIIGVNGAGLKYAEEDAKEFRAFLERSIPPSDLHVVPLLGAQATQREVMKAIYSAAANTSTQGTVLVYFSGHGVLLDTMGSVGAYFVPSEVQDTDHPTDFISHKQVLEYLAQSKAAHKILISDSCFSGLSLTSEIPKSTDSEWTSKSLMDIQRVSLINKAKSTYKDWLQIPATVLWFSGAQGSEVSYESSKFKGGVFTHYLLQSVANPVTYRMAVDEIEAQMKKDKYNSQHVYLITNNEFEKMLIPLPKRTAGIQ